MRVRWYDGKDIRQAVVKYMRFNGKDDHAVFTTQEGETVRVPNAQLLDGWWKGA